MINSPEVNLYRPSTTADSWGRYYTANWVSKSLIESMNFNSPKIILELGAGRGILAAEAGNKWPCAELITVDMDQSATSLLKNVSLYSHSYHKHYIHDVLDHNLSDQINLPLESVDVAVCNPPYIRPRWRTSFAHILEDAGFSGSLKSIHDAGADLLFIAQNLRLLKNHGKLGLILPDGLITSERFTGVRKTLLLEHLVEQVIQLPRRIFSKTEAQTYLVILSKKSGETKNVKLTQIDINGMMYPTISIERNLAQKRLDYSYHTTIKDSSHIKHHQPIFIREFTEKIIRGSISSHQINNYNLPVFHLGDFKSEIVPPEFSISEDIAAKLPKNIKISLPGDILIARIGRNLHEKIAIVQHGPCITTDCIFSLRVDPIKFKLLASFLKSKIGRLALKASSHGVGAKYLSKSDILNLEITK